MKMNKLYTDFSKTVLPSILVAAASFNEKEFSKYCDGVIDEDFTLSIKQILILGLEKYYSKAKKKIGKDPNVKIALSNIQTLIDRLNSDITGVE
jgi:hypothetical protein